MGKYRQISVFVWGKRAFFLLRGEIPLKAYKLARLWGEYGEFTTRKTLIVCLIALLSDMSLSRREQGTMRYFFLEKLIAPWRNILKRPLDRSAEGASAADLRYFTTGRYSYLYNL
jgi:hypothetical protein